MKCFSLFFPFVPLRASSWIIFFLLLTSPLFGQTTAPSTAPSSFEVRQWVVLICSPFQDKANQDGSVLSTLPPSVESRRQSAPAEQQNDPQPIGVIRLIGQADAPVDVSLGVPKGKVMAAWPKAKMKTSGLLWANLKTSADLSSANNMESQAEPEAAGAMGWLGDLRHDQSAWLRNDESVERFLACDLELEYRSPLKIATTGDSKSGDLKSGDFSYNLSNVFPEAMLNLNLYKPVGGGWRHAEMSQLGGASAFVAATHPTTSTALVLASTQPVRVADLTLDVSPATQPADLLGPWKERLLGQGLGESDVDLIVRILEKHALDPKRLTAVYELDDAEMDRLLPLEVLPEPAKIVRVGLVIVKDIDPGVASEIDELVGQLGNDDWSTRDAAYQALAKLGKAAKPQLEKAMKNGDLEVVWRAERLMALMSRTPASDQPAVQN